MLAAFSARALLPRACAQASEVAGPCGIAAPLALQVRWKNQINSVSLLRQYYNRMPIRKKWRKAIMRGTMVMCEKTGQVKMPTLAISGYDEKNPYRGRFENLKSTRVWFKD
ncbi:unnamed protein product [Polarella glacialis]|uniref:Uncharacterized protein n=1 Tax=Polarella glacialis TaxID=89957 RepID=A0A813KI25_POLGL|nr:unnamed protein product [Polarella glacialis]CAE8588456.1 unnamed protein product [Polarella glacialis]CAE8645218.1 unnamed protein product [Polarella glacialis]CAE8705097.1 unnamed protein product [Polarella glacialis]